MALERYNAPEREKHWQKIWEEQETFLTSPDRKKPKYYVLEMFPYPSGRIHVGHVRNYVMGDVVARYKRARGFNVLHPFGWDAFGLPAENAAMQQNINPREWTYDNIEVMRAQLKRIGLSLDWSREFATCDPDYYHQQQRLFLAFYEAGLVYRKKSKVNWDPVDHTVLANEQVIDGRGWRSGALVEQKELAQWFFKITHYADDLLEGLDTLDKWPEKVRVMQRNWIGKSQGLLMRFNLSGERLPAGFPRVEVFTTRPDTIFGASFIGISPEHPLAQELAKSDPKLQEFIEECRRIGTAQEEIDRAEKKGYDTGIVAAHPFRSTMSLPVYVANFILMDYGTGAIFGCPAHDQRDLDFARKYRLKVKAVVVPQGVDPAEFKVGAEAYTGPGRLANSSFLNGMAVEDAKEEVAQRLAKRNMAEKRTTYRLRDWGVSRQRYWGCPIPMIHCETCGVVPVPDKDLPVLLRPMCRSTSREIRSTRHSDLERHVACPVLRRQGHARDRYLRHLRGQFLVFRTLLLAACERAGGEGLGRLLAAGGSVYRRRGACDPASALCPLLHARHEGLRLSCVERAVRGSLHARHGAARNLLRRQSEMGRAIGCSHRDRRRRPQGLPPGGKCEPIQIGGVEKMSKSKKNTIDPDIFTEHYGADTARWFMLSDSPPERDVLWTEEGVQGDGASCKGPGGF